MRVLQYGVSAVARARMKRVVPRRENFGKVNRMGARARTCVSVRLRAREKWIVVT
jgi:hypothetical protein